MLLLLLGCRQQKSEARHAAAKVAKPAKAVEPETDLDRLLLDPLKVHVPLAAPAASELGPTKPAKATGAPRTSAPGSGGTNPPNPDVHEPPDRYPPNFIIEQIMETAMDTQTEISQADASQIIGQISNDGLTFRRSESPLQLPTHLPPELEKLALRYICKMWKVKEIPVM